MIRLPHHLAFAIGAALSLSMAAPAIAQDKSSLDRLVPHALDVTTQSGFDAIAAAIGNRRIVMLGEASHGDASSFETKAALIDYLHREHGFDVLVFESGLFDLGEADRKAQAGTTASAALGEAIFPVWAKADQFAALNQVIDRAQAEGTPFTLAGFDFQPSSGNIQLLGQALHVLSDRIDGPAVGAVAQKLDGLVNGKMAALMALDTRDLDTKIEATRGDLAKLAPAEQSYWTHVLTGFGKFVRFAQILAKGPQPGELNIRDEVMADNFAMLANELYPNRKIIVWAATSHILKDRTAIDVAGDKDMVPMGAHLAASPLAPQIYVIAMTALDGQTGSMLREPMAIGAAGEGTLEASVMGILPDASAAFVDLAPVAGERFVARGLGHAQWEGAWAKAVDGIIVIRDMKPTSYPTKPE